MPTIEANAQTRRFLNEQIRPLAGTARKVYASGIAINTIISDHLAQPSTPAARSRSTPRPGS